MIGDKKMKLFKDYKNYWDYMQPYRSAVNLVKAKLEGIDDELKCEHGYSPIHQIQSRIKSLESIEEKIERKHYSNTLDSLKKLYDIAGLRVICHYINDIQYISQLFIMHEDIHLLKTVNYINYPKESGYQSLHLVVEVSIYCQNGLMKIPVEIQLRTIAMDCWASLEHDLLYKNKRAISKDIQDELKECAKRIALTDLQMQRIYQKVYQEKKKKKKQSSVKREMLSNL